MKIKALRSLTGDYGQLRRGAVTDIPDHRAQQLIKRGLVVPVQGVAREVAGKPESPTESRPAGGQTGKAKPSSSSPQAQARKTSPSKSSRAKPAS
jgi:hypothetical protein